MDLIDRQAAIEKLISNLTYMHTFGADRSIDLIEELPAVQTCEDAVSRADVLETYADLYDVFEDSKAICKELHKVYDRINALPSVQPQPVVRCKDCKHWRDSDGVYRRGVNAESKCPLNTKEVYAGTFYCGDAERRTDEE